MKFFLLDTTIDGFKSADSSFHWYTQFLYIKVKKALFQWKIVYLMFHRDLILYPFN